MYNFTDLTPDKYVEIKRVAQDWQYLIVLAGGMATKSKCEDWLMPRYGIDRYTAHTILNDITGSARCFTCGSDGVWWNEYNAQRPAPRKEDYPDIPGLF